MNTIHDDRYKKLIQKLIFLRNLRGITQVELARRLNESQSYVSKTENLERRVDILEFVNWLNAIEDGYGEKIMDAVENLWSESNKD